MRAMIAVITLTASILLFAGGCEKTIKEGVNRTPLTEPVSR
jgi:hypothetical protein